MSRIASRGAAAPSVRRSRAFEAMRLASILLLFGCAEDQAEVRLFFGHTLGARSDSPPVIAEQPVSTRYGQNLHLDDLRYTIAGVELIAADGSTEVLSSGKQDIGLHSEELSLPAAPGTYTGLRLRFGEPESQQNSPSLSISGRTDEQPLSIAIAGNARRLLSIAFAQELVLTAESAISLNIQADIERIFAGISLEHGAIEGTADDPTVRRLLTNATGMFFFRKGEELRPFEVTTPRPDAPVVISRDPTPPALRRSPIDPENLRCEERPCRSFAAATGDSLADAITLAADLGSAVHSPVAGTVTRVAFFDHVHLTHSDLFALEIQGSEDAAFAVVLRRLDNVQVAEGDQVHIGDRLGTAGAKGTEEDIYGAIEFAVRREQPLAGQLRQQWLCPLRYADEATQLTLGEACEAPSLFCTDSACANLSIAQGDVHSGAATYRQACLSCHGSGDEPMTIGPPLCADCGCISCREHGRLARRIAVDMPPEGSCEGRCAEDVAAFLLAPR